MKAIITKLIATLTLTIAALFTVPALAESGAFASNTGFGYTAFCIAALISIIALWVVTMRRTKYKF